MSFLTLREDNRWITDSRDQLTDVRYALGERHYETVSMPWPACRLHSVRCRGGDGHTGYYGELCQTGTRFT